MTKIGLIVLAMALSGCSKVDKVTDTQAVEQTIGNQPAIDEPYEIKSLSAETVLKRIKSIYLHKEDVDTGIESDDIRLLAPLPFAKYLLNPDGSAIQERHPGLEVYRVKSLHDNSRGIVESMARANKIPVKSRNIASIARSISDQYILTINVSGVGYVGEVLLPAYDIVDSKGNSTKQFPIWNKYYEPPVQRPSWLSPDMIPEPVTIGSGSASSQAQADQLLYWKFKDGSSEIQYLWASRASDGSRVFSDPLTRARFEWTRQSTGANSQAMKD
jgi:hypothetical protein